MSCATDQVCQIAKIVQRISGTTISNAGDIFSFEEPLQDRIGHEYVVSLSEYAERLRTQLVLIRCKLQQAEGKARIKTENYLAENVQLKSALVALEQVSGSGEADHVNTEREVCIT